MVAGCNMQYAIYGCTPYSIRINLYFYSQWNVMIGFDISSSLSWVSSSRAQLGYEI